jgi:hypothetical protein
MFAGDYFYLAVSTGGEVTIMKDEAGRTAI